MQQFFYDGQIRRFVTQFIRLVSNFQVEFGKDRDGVAALQRVPVIYGDQSRQAAQILRGNSENALPTVPAMAVYISSLDYDRERVQSPTHVSTINVREQRIDPITGNTTGQQTEAFSIDRLMPVPYRLGLKLDIWTSNTEQKLQIIEQIAGLFNPALEIQNTDNYIDWTSLSAVFLKGTVWDSRSVPSGADEMISIATLTFDLPIWISSPARVKRMGVIHRVIQSVYDANGDISKTIFDDSSYLTRKIITPYGYNLLYINGSLVLMKASDLVVDQEPTSRNSWKSLIDVYGVLTNGISEVRLYVENEGIEIVGRVAYHPSDNTTLMFTPDIDTMPADTISGGIDAIIDPTKNNVLDLLYRTDDNTYDPGWSRGVARSGQPVRYLLLKGIGDVDNTYPAEAWGDLQANANDIIEWDGESWRVVFDSETKKSTTHYVTNLNTLTQYRWNDGQWSKSVEGIYQEGQWSIVL